MSVYTHFASSKFTYLSSMAVYKVKENLYTILRTFDSNCHELAVRKLEASSARQLISTGGI